MKRVIESLIAGCISGILLIAVDRYGGVLRMVDWYRTFAIELWPIWGGLIVTTLYWFIRYELDTRKSIKTAAEEIVKINKALKNTNDSLYDSWNRTVENYNNVLRELFTLRQTLEQKNDLAETKE